MFKSLKYLVLIDYWKFGKWSNMLLIQTWLLFFFSHGVLRVAYSTHVVNSELKSTYITVFCTSLCHVLPRLWIWCPILGTSAGAFPRSPSGGGIWTASWSSPPPSAGVGSQLVLAAGRRHRLNMHLPERAGKNLTTGIDTISQSDLVKGYWFSTICSKHVAWGASNACTIHRLM